MNLAIALNASLCAGAALCSIGLGTILGAF
jgi:hypothetical protein